MDGADVVTPGPTCPPGILYIRNNTQKSKFLLSQAFEWKKIMFFVIPEIPSKTFVMLYKKNFLITLRLNMIFLGYNDNKEAYIEDAFHVRVPLQRLQLLLQL